MVRLLSPAISSAITLAGAGFKRIGPKLLNDNATAYLRGNLLQDFDLIPGRAFTICNASRESVAGATATKILYVTTSGPTVATGTLTFTGLPVADETITIEARVYTFKATVGATADEIMIGADITEMAA